MAGLGFAAIRDFATFLKFAKADQGGTANPLAGDVQDVYATCVSQPCRTTHDFVLLGFNQPESSSLSSGPWKTSGFGQSKQPLVLDGILNWIGGGDGIFMNYRFAQPTRTSRQHIARWYPEFQFPWANQPTLNPVTKQLAGRLDTCLPTKTCRQDCRAKFRKRVLLQRRLAAHDGHAGP